MGLLPLWRGSRVKRRWRGAGIKIVAIHHHMIGETPRYVFLHYWGRGKAADLAPALQTARDEQTNLGSGHQSQPQK